MCCEEGAGKAGADGFSFEKQSVLLPGAERIRVAHGTKEGTQLMETAFQLEKKTVSHLFRRGLAVANGTQNCLGTIVSGAVSWLTYTEVSNV